MLAPDGRCKTLDGGADGYVRGEGCEVLLLVAAGSGDAAVAGGCAVLCGSAVNQDGRSSSLTAPNGPAQQEVIGLALRSGELTGGAVGALQMHGTGTALGDPIEVGGAAAVLLGEAGRAPLVLSAVKSFVGHAECAAGLTGVAAAVAALAKRRGFNPGAVAARKRRSARHQPCPPAPAAASSSAPSAITIWRKASPRAS
jgi:acyl transferase domain-containing protein